MSQAELSRVVAIEPPTMVRTIDRMVRDGLVDARARSARRAHQPHPADRSRSVPEGRAVPKAAAVNAANLQRLTRHEG